MKILLQLVLFSLIAAGSCRADGGVVLLQQSSAGLDVTVFASPAPLRAGPVDFSVLVQEAGGQTPIFDAQVVLACVPKAGAASAWLPPCCMMDGADKVTATLANSKNKMLYSAILPVKSAGRSKLLVAITRQGKIVNFSNEIEAGPAAAPVVTYWPCLAFPPFLIAGFALHQCLSRGQRRRDRRQKI